MEENKRNEESTGFKVTDKRHFTKEGESLPPSAESEPKPEQKETTTPPREERSAKAPPEKDAGPAGGEAGQPGPVDFTHLVMSLASTAFLSLGVPDPMTKQKGEVNLPAASQMIDLLTVLDEKTKGNLTDQEEQIVKGALTDLRQLYIQASGFVK